MSAPTPGRVPVRPAFVPWRVAVGAGCGLGATAAIVHLTMRGFVWWQLVAIAACLIGGAWVLDRAKQSACGACGTILRTTIIRLPITIAEALAESVTTRGSLDPALPNHLPPDGEPAYTALIGEVCPRCKRAAKVHVSRYGKLASASTDQLRVTWEPLTTEQLLDEKSAAFLAQLSRYL